MVRRKMLPYWFRRCSLATIQRGFLDSIDCALVSHRFGDIQAAQTAETRQQPVGRKPGSGKFAGVQSQALTRPFVKSNYFLGRGYVLSAQLSGTDCSACRVPRKHYMSKTSRCRQSVSLEQLLANNHKISSLHRTAAVGPCMALRPTLLPVSLLRQL